jgi:hypothetical protein
LPLRSFGLCLTRTLDPLRVSVVFVFGGAEAGVIVVGADVIDDLPAGLTLEVPAGDKVRLVARQRPGLVPVGLPIREGPVPDPNLCNLAPASTSTFILYPGRSDTFLKTATLPGW